MLVTLPRNLLPLLFVMTFLPCWLQAATPSSAVGKIISVSASPETSSDIDDFDDGYTADFELAGAPEKPQPKKNPEKEYTRGRMAFLFGQYEAAYKIWRPLAEAGYAKAQATVGWMYHTGKGAKKDYLKAFEWYKKAAKQNHAIAQNNLGVFYEQGLGVGKSAKSAAKWYREAAEWGYSYAQYNLGMLYQQGLGVKQDDKEAQFWLQIAALQGVEQATAELQKISGEVHGNSDIVAKGPEWKKNQLSDNNKASHRSPHSSSGYKNMAERIKTRRSQLDTSGYGGSLSGMVEPQYSSSKPAPLTKNKAAAKAAQPKAKADIRTQTPKITTKDIPEDKFDKWLADARVAQQRLKKLKTEKKTNSHSLKIYNDEWVREQDPKFYTLQLARSDELDWLLNIAKKQPMLKDTAYYTEIIEGKKWYYLVYGSFKNQESANNEIENLPKALKRWSPWVRRFSQVQSKMAASAGENTKTNDKRK